jgi:hypothetical protein
MDIGIAAGYSPVGILGPLSRPQLKIGLAGMATPFPRTARNGGKFVPMKRLVLALCLMASLLAWPAVPGWAAAQEKEAWQQRRERITELHAQARQMRYDAKLRHDADMARCSGELLPSGCIDKANKRRLEMDNQAMRLDHQAAQLGREARNEVKAAKEANKVERARYRGRAPADGGQGREQGALREAGNGKDKD